MYRLIPAGVIDKLVKVKNMLFRNDMFTYDKSPGRVAGIKEMPPSQLLYAEIKVLVKKNVDVSIILNYLKRIVVYYLFR